MPAPSSNIVRLIGPAGVLAAALILAPFLAPAFAPAPAQAQSTQDHPRQMTITGYGEAAGVPDMAVVTMGVTTEAKTAKAALDDNSKAMSKVFARLKAEGVAEKDIQTSNFSISPQYRRYDSSQPDRRREIVGYTVSNQVTVRVRKMESLGTILDTVVADGANELGGLSFTFSDPEPLANEARKAAVADARAKAELYAKAAGVDLGEVLSISEFGGGRPQQKEMAATRAASDSVPVAAGESALSVSVSITYALD